MAVLLAYMMYVKLGQTVGHVGLYWTMGILVSIFTILKTMQDFVNN